MPDEEKTEPFCRCCINAILEAAALAQERLCHARLRYGEGAAYVNVNRDSKYTGSQPDITSPYVMAKNIHGYSDHTVSVLEFVDDDSQTFAYVVGYAVHSSALFQQFWGEDGGMLISGDLSGAAMRYVEERSDAVALHLLGAAADQNARFNVIEPTFDRYGNVSNVNRSEAGYAVVDLMAEEWGSEVFLAAKNAVEISADTLAAAKLTITAPTKEKYEGGPPTTLPVGYEWKIGGAADLNLSMIRIGPLTLFGIPGELVARAGDSIKQALLACGFTQAMVVTQCNGAVSYLSDADGYEKRHLKQLKAILPPALQTESKKALKCLLLCCFSNHDRAFKRSGTSSNRHLHIGLNMIKDKNATVVKTCKPLIEVCTSFYFIV